MHPHQGPPESQPRRHDGRPPLPLRMRQPAGPPLAPAGSRGPVHAPPSHVPQHRRRAEARGCGGPRAPSAGERGGRPPPWRMRSLSGAPSSRQEGRPSLGEG